MWIHPDGERLIVGNDGGVVISPNRGGSWRFVANLPLGQFYHINVDMQYPYHVYGGLQDNGTWRGPAYTLRERSVTNESWLSVGGGDGFDAAPDPEDPDCGYGMSQGGSLYYFDVRTGTSRDRRAHRVRRQAPLQLERRVRRRPLQAGDDLLRQPVRPPEPRQRPDLGDHQPRPDDERRRQAEAVGERRA